MFISADNIGIGTDIESTGKFRGIEKNNSLINKIFTEEEIKYCYSKQTPEQHLAVRFSAKESVIKAFGMLGISPPPLTKIEINNLENGQPVVKLDKEYDSFTIKLSLSHNEDTAIAMVIIIKQ